MPHGGATMMVVDDKSQVKSRVVVIAQAIGDKWLISEGLQPGDRAVVSGLQKARPGVRVKAIADTGVPTTKVQ